MIQDSEIKVILDEQRQEYQHYLGVIAEQFQQNLKLIAESVGDLQKQLISLREMVAKNTEDIEVIKLELTSIKNMLKRKVDTDEFESLEKRVAMLEHRR